MKKGTVIAGIETWKTMKGVYANKMLAAKGDNEYAIPFISLVKGRPFL
jgi:hypothetical protein